MNLVNKYLNGHINIGNITVYGENAMHWAINIKMFGTYFCFRLPFFCFGKWWPLYFYISSEATPQKATVLLGSGHGIEDKAKARFRRRIYGTFRNVSSIYDSKIYDVDELKRISRDYVVDCLANKSISSVVRYSVNERLFNSECNMNITENAYELCFTDITGTIATITVNKETNYISMSIKAMTDFDNYDF